MLAILSLPHSNAECERVFSRVNDIKTRKGSKLLTKTIRENLLTQQAIQRHGKINGQDGSSPGEPPAVLVKIPCPRNMGQQTSKKNGARSCDCGCGAWERHGFPGVNQLASDRWSHRECRCARRRSRRPPCVCTGYRRVSDACHDERLAAVLTLGSSELRREIDAIVLNTESGETVRDHGEPVNAELYVLSVAPRQPEGAAGAVGTAERPLELPNLQNVDNIRHIQVRAYLVRAPLPSQPESPHLGAHRVHTQVDYIHCLVPDLREITACAFYWGKMDRYEAERLLENKPEGTFLLRDSAQEEHLFSVSFRKYGRSLHARIEHYQRRFSFDSHDPAVFAASTVTGLIEHYKDPNCVMFFEPILTAPLPRREPFTLQQLARAVVVSSTTYDGVEQLPLPPRLRAYLQQYHYRQRVRVRRLL